MSKRAPACWCGMQRKLKHPICFLAIAIFVFGGLIMTPSASAQPVKIIFDSDIGPDCDDAGAMAVLHALADNGEAEILGMACCTSSEWGAPCLDAINTYYGRPDIPVGTLKAKGFLAEAKHEQYNKGVAQEFPNNLGSGKNAPDAVRLYRQILAGQPDNSVVFVTVGPLPNIKNLLNSEPDEISPLNGAELVAQKAALLVSMGGAYPAGNEYNFNQDAAATQVMMEKCSIPMVFSGFEIGSAIMTGARLQTETPVSNPVRRAFELYGGTNEQGNRQSWDETAVLYAVRGARDYWDVVEEGCNTVDNIGRNRWRSEPDLNHSYLVAKKSPEEMAKIIEDMMVQTPKLGRASVFEKAK